MQKQNILFWYDIKTKGANLKRLGAHATTPALTEM